jgi:hypothetical protein
MKQTSKQRTNWKYQERDNSGRFGRLKVIESSGDVFRDLERFKYTINDLQKAFYAGLKSNNSFYPPSKLWEFYKRDRGL